jgi:transposase
MVRRGRRKVVLYLDPSLKIEEERDLLSRVEEGKSKMKEFFDRQCMFGTISVLTGTDMDAEVIYSLPKSRMDIEQLFDTFKNTLHADRTYMHNNNHMQGRMFVNFVLC